MSIRVLLIALLLQLLAPGLSVSLTDAVAADRYKQTGHATAAAPILHKAGNAAKAASAVHPAGHAALLKPSTAAGPAAKQNVAEQRDKQGVHEHQHLQSGLPKSNLGNSQTTAAHSPRHTTAAVAADPPAGALRFKNAVAKPQRLEPVRPLVVSSVAPHRVPPPVTASRTAHQTGHAAVSKPSAIVEPAAAVVKPAAAVVKPAAAVVKPAAAVVKPAAAVVKPAAAVVKPAAAAVKPAAAVVKPAAAVAKPAAVTKPAAAVAKPAAASSSAARSIEPPAAQLPLLGPLSVVQNVANAVGGFLGSLFGFKVSTPEQEPAATQPAPAPTAAVSVAHKTSAAAVAKPSRPFAAAVQKPAVKPASAAAAQKPAVKLPGSQAAMCEWRSDFSSCVIGRKYLLAITWKPESYISKLVSAAAARDQACSAYTTPDDCIRRSPVDLLCDWNMGGSVGWDLGCHSRYLSEWTVFAELAGEVGAVAAAGALEHAGSLTCPGSLAEKTLGCSNLYPMDQQGNWAPNFCQQGVGCTYDDANHSCATSPSMAALVAGLQPTVVGSCSAACYLRMLNKCTAADKEPAAGREAWCSRQPGCQWQSGACKVDVWLSHLDRWGKQARQAALTCAQQNNQHNCATAAAKGALRMNPDRVHQFLGQPVSYGSASVKCPV